MDAQINDFLKKIAEGELHAKYDCWMFSGGRDWGDWTRYSVFDENWNEIGYADINVTNLGFEYRTTDGDLVISAEVMTEDDFGDVDCTFFYAVKRDDPEFINKITINGEVHWPMDFCDISRDDVLSGAYEIDCER